MHVHGGGAAARAALLLLLLPARVATQHHISAECDAKRVAHYHAECTLDPHHPWFARTENSAIIDVHHGLAFHPILKAGSSAVHNEMRYLDGHDFAIVKDDTNLRQSLLGCCDDGSYADFLNFTFVREPVERFLSAYHFLAEQSHVVCKKLDAADAENKFCRLLSSVPKHARPMNEFIAADDDPTVKGDDPMAHALLEAFVDVCEKWGWVGPSRFFNAHALPQALQLAGRDGRPMRTLNHVRLLPGAAAVVEPAARARDMADQVAELYEAACPNEDCEFKDRYPDKPDWAGMHLSPNRWFSVSPDKIPEPLLVRACALVLVDYCGFPGVRPSFNMFGTTVSGSETLSETPVRRTWVCERFSRWEPPKGAESHVLLTLRRTQAASTSRSRPSAWPRACPATSTRACRPGSPRPRRRTTRSTAAPTASSRPRAATSGSGTRRPTSPTCPTCPSCSRRGPTTASRARRRRRHRRPGPRRPGATASRTSTRRSPRSSTTTTSSPTAGGTRPRGRSARRAPRAAPGGSCPRRP